MRFITILSIFLPLSTYGFAPSLSGTVRSQSSITTTSLEATSSRRDAIMNGISSMMYVAAAGGVTTTIFPSPSMAFSQQLEDWKTEPAQLPTGGKYDLNSAFVGDYKKLRGMFPHAAGKIASNGPYEKVSDIYSIPGLTKNDKTLFKMYEDQFTVNPPGRAFKERINARVST